MSGHWKKSQRWCRRLPPRSAVITNHGNLQFQTETLPKGNAYTKAARVTALLELVGLPAHYARRHPSALSGGEQQRVALARALAPKPDVVLLDEPFSALDAGLRAETRQAVAASLKQVGTTALLVTHDQDEALSMGDKVAVLQRGQLAQIASPRVLYRCPASQGIARFIGEAVLVAGTVAGDAVDCCFGRLPLMPEAQLTNGYAHHNVEVLIRPGSTPFSRTIWKGLKTSNPV